PRPSERIAVKPETGIYRRFDGLNVRHIPYLQAKLCTMGRHLHLLEKQDKKGAKGGRAEYAIDYECVLKEPRSEQSEHLKLIGKMNDNLNQYNKALIQLSLVHQINPTDRFDLHDVQCFLESEDMGPDYMNDYRREDTGRTRRSR
ncbi:hypothetical protein EJ02DRAFT_477764, partial [Clathrospora elynae]